MLAAFVSADLIKKRRTRLQQLNMERKNSNITEVNHRLTPKAQSPKNTSKKNDLDDSQSREKKLSLLRRYMELLKSTMIAFFLSTSIHVACVSCYFYTFLYLNPDDPGKKKFYAATTVTPGINIGGKMVGGGGISSNHHKSYAFHLIREHYKGLNYKFFFQFSAIYLIILVWLKFFSQRAQLKKDTAEVFNLDKNEDASKNRTSDSDKESHGSSVRNNSSLLNGKRSLLSVKKQLKKRNILRKKNFKIENDIIDEEEYSEEEIIEGDEYENMPEKSSENILPDIKKDN